ncbi:hypothetical protein [Paeniglutamicibacter psychrophenolicus]|uniref:hypothetical protein n=1 Tax=Paeniglutamicibacter psychrophenolicus TaxID=257454 RepID=UPI002789B7E1|nr:hypothetical protein [Paeniglutamicibacter psychrophenolicus]MDQ0093285.1 hypothetical protein [Paeniglutamicibacter psychrophenolicus]
MSSHGDNTQDLMVMTRATLLDALEALREHRESVIVIGAQAIYLRTGGLDVALAESTKDSDMAIDPRSLGRDPLVEAAMRNGGFLPSANKQPGAWVSANGIPVDLMVPQAFAGANRRSANIPPHDANAFRNARGLEAALVDWDKMDITAIDPADDRTINVKVAGPGALLVAKLHKIAERVNTPHRLNDKDAHDIYRLLRATETETLATIISKLLENELSTKVTRESLDSLRELFALGPDALGSKMAGRAEEGIGEPEQVSVSVSFLAQDLLDELMPYPGD